MILEAYSRTLTACLLQPVVYQYIPPGFGENRHPDTGSWNDPWLVIGNNYYSAEIRAIRDVGDRRGVEWVRYYFTAPADDAREYAWIQSLGEIFHDYSGSHIHVY